MIRRLDRHTLVAIERVADRREKAGVNTVDVTVKQLRSLLGEVRYHRETCR